MSFSPPGINKLSACYQPSHHCEHWSCLSDKRICSQTIFFQPGQFPLVVTNTMCLRCRHLAFVLTLAPSSQFRSSQSILLSAITVPTVLSLHLKGAHLCQASPAPQCPAHSPR